MTVDCRFHKESHSYWIDGVKVPSVTELVSLLYDPYQGAPKRVLEAKADLGLRVHTALQLLDLGIDPEPEDDIAGRVEAWRKFTADNKCKWSLIETPMFSPTMMFGGTPDRFGEVNNVPTGVDIKNTYNIEEGCGVQLSGYDILCGRQMLRRLVVQLLPNGQYKLQEFEDESATFLSLLNIYHWRRKHGQLG